MVGASLGAVLGAGGSAEATTSTLYVSSTGTDSGTCATSAAPCATVSYALTQASSPGDTILVSGTINDNVVVSSRAVEIAQDPGGSPAVLDGTGKGPVITTEGNTVLTVNQLTLTGGSAPDGGGAFLEGGSAQFTESTISGNTAMDSGGGIDAGGEGGFNLIDSTVSGNTALGSGSVGGTGGGIATSGPAGGGNIIRSTISGNTAGGVGSGAEGGGLVNDGGQLIISNSTISGNTATGVNGGGGGVSDEGGPVIVTDSTISGNAASSYGAAIESVNGVSLAGDIVADAGGPPAVTECQGSAPTDLGYNVDDDGTCGLSASNHSVSDSATIRNYLGPLQNNGGPTDTIALSSGPNNPAQAVIPLAFTVPPGSTPACRLPDQRGVARGAPCDMGAYALTVGVAPAITSATSTNFTVGANGTFSFRATGSPPPTFSETGQLPAGISLSSAGLLSGTPGSGAAGVYPITVTATNGVAPDAHQAFTIDVASAPPPPTHGYWLVGSDGGIFSFGSAQFYGSTGNLHLQRPVVGIVPTKDRGGYWLDASDGGVFSFGDTQFYGSIPGLGLHPAGSGLPNSLNAPIVGMVPSHDQGGYFMVASDGGVFAFGDAHFAGSCPGIGGCSGAAVAVMPDASGNGYWLITQSGNVYTFGDAPYLGAPGAQSSPITSAVATPSGHGYYILDAAGQVFAYGDANGGLGNVPAGATGGTNPASAIFATSDGGGYWVTDAQGKVFTFGDAPNDGDMSGTVLNGPIIAASGS
jgi:parallel beta-helix repeat protein